jgi:hypothetical protein
MGLHEFREFFFAFVAVSFLDLVLPPDTPKFILRFLDATINNLMIHLIGQLVLHFDPQAMASVGWVFNLFENLYLYRFLFVLFEFSFLTVFLITVELWFMPVIYASICIM